MKGTSRRTFLKGAGFAGVTTVIGGSLAGCGGDDAPRQDPPPAPTLTTSEQLALTGTQAIAAIAAGTVSCETYVTTLLDRAQAQRDLNAMIVLDRAGAIAAARDIDARRRAGTALPALAGLPMVVKDNINTRTLPTTGGTPALRNFQPSSNAPSLQRLIDAGAIVLGKANLHELAFGITATNFTPFAGFVKNPYDKTRIPGGSSGGTGAAIAARFAPVGLGTDTGGSVRVPSALCGIAGLRPSVGNGGVQRRYVNTNAVIPISHTRDTVGPMGRTVADIALLDSVITGRALPSAVGLRGLRIGIPASFWAGLDSQVASIANSARTRLAAAGAVFVEVDLPGIFDLDNQVSFQVALHEPIADVPAYLAANNATGITLASIAAGVASPDVKGAFSAILADVYGPQYANAINVLRPQLQAQYARYFTDNAVDAIMFPTTVAPAIPIDPVAGSSTTSINGGPPVDTFTTFIRNCDPGSNAGIPGLSVFGGVTSTGLPVGIAFDGPVGSDSTLLGIGLSVEAILGVAPAPVL